MGPLLVDIYAGDVHGKPDIAKIVAAGLPWIGVDLKVSQGIQYASGQWLNTYWPIARNAAGARYGKTWFRGGYHYLQFDKNQSALAQARFFLKQIDKAGGWGPGDLMATVDVEEAAQPAGVTAQQVIDYTSIFSLEILKQTGRRAVCYGGSYIRGLGITSHMECESAWVACYGPTLPPKIYQQMGYPDWKKVYAWQYCGTEAFTGPPNYPQVSPAGHVDISTMLMDGGGDAAIAYLVSHCPPENPDLS